jgi:hypothetical protein
MTYPTPPAPRIAYDLDGSRAFVLGRVGGMGAVEAAPAFLQYMNSDTPRYGRVPGFTYWPYETAPPTDAWVAVRLATPTHLEAIAFSAAWQAQRQANGDTFNNAAAYLLGILETSQDSTNGQDGTWTMLKNYSSGDELDFSLTVAGAGDAATMVGAASVDGTIVAVSAVGNFRTLQEHRTKNNGTGTRGWREVAGAGTRQVRWVRFRVSGYEPNAVNTVGFGSHGGAFKLHLYGSPDTTASETRLEFVTPGGGEKIFDWGDLGMGQTRMQQFKVRNLAAMTAEEVTVTIAPSNPAIIEAPQSWLEMSLDGVTWDTSLQLGDLAGGAMSDTVTLRVTAEETLVGPWSPRITAEAGGWI